MKRAFLPFLLILVFILLTGCGDKSSDGIKIPSSAGVYKGQDYQKVVTGLEQAGFTNVSTEALEDLIIGFLTKDGEVEQVSVDGEAKYNPDARYPSDVKIIVTYHTFPKENSEESTNPSKSESTQQSTGDSQDLILSVDNNKDLDAVLSTKGEINPIYNDFATNYKGRTIKFDGHIDYITNHGNYDTRWDILLSVGDWVDEETAYTGPVFKFEDVGLYNLGIEDLFLPEYVSVGSNVHIVAKIIEYNENTGIFFLKPTLLEAR